LLEICTQFHVGNEAVALFTKKIDSINQGEYAKRKAGKIGYSKRQNGTILEWCRGRFLDQYQKQ